MPRALPRKMYFAVEPDVGQPPNPDDLDSATMSDDFEEVLKTFGRYPKVALQTKGGFIEIPTRLVSYEVTARVVDPEVGPVDGTHRARKIGPSPEEVEGYKAYQKTPITPLRQRTINLADPDDVEGP